MDLLVDEHGLFDLVQKVFDVLRSTEKITTDNCESHLWSLTFHRVKYDNGWRGHEQHYLEEERRTLHHIDSQEPRLLADLLDDLAPGQTGRFSGESASFDIVVVDSNLVQQEHDDPAAAGTPASYPRATALALVWSGALEDDWITTMTDDDDDLSWLSQAIDLRERMQAYMQSNTSSWRRNPKYRYEEDDPDWIRCKPLAPQWSPEENRIMGLLIKSGCKFTQSWNVLLQYCMVNRAKTAASGRWYKLQQSSYMLEYIGKDLKSKAERIVFAKRKARAMLERALERGIPSSEHPWAKTVTKLRKRGLLTDDMNKSEKRRLIVEYHGILHVD